MAPKFQMKGSSLICCDVGYGLFNPKFSFAK